MRKGLARSARPAFRGVPSTVKRSVSQALYLGRLPLSQVEKNKDKVDTMLKDVK